MEPLTSKTHTYVCASCGKVLASLDSVCYCAPLSKEPGFEWYGGSVDERVVKEIVRMKREQPYSNTLYDARWCAAYPNVAAAMIEGLRADVEDHKERRSAYEEALPSNPLVQRLRGYGGWPIGLLTKEAADEIERLTRELEKAQDHSHWYKQTLECSVEIDRLRAALEDAIGALAAWYESYGYTPGARVLMTGLRAARMPSTTYPQDMPQGASEVITGANRLTDEKSVAVKTTSARCLCGCHQTGSLCRECCEGA